jgi:signal transduction histidine kinase
MCDSAHIKFVIKTIIENAIQYTKEGGNINVRNVIDHDKILFSVKDNGIGINPNEIKLIFSKFYRTEEARSMDTEGMGIGLFVAKEIINRHKGKIQAESQGINKGSTFSFWIPKTE